MIIKTNLEWLYPELLEEAKFFSGTGDIEINHTHSSNFVDEIDICGKKYNYTNYRDFSTLLEEKRYIKRFAKLALYNAMSDYLGQNLPWGALTGIRPVKFAYGEGERWRKEMGDVMRVSPKKLDMVAAIMEQQKPFTDIAENSCDLFIGIPFCPSRCLYCSFMSSEIGKCDNANEYVDALVKEINASKPLIGNLRSVYIGGGTPISLPISQLSRILETVGDVNCEYTVEAGRPDCITDDVLKLLSDHGVTRICVNPQTFKDDTLELLGRKHTVKEIYDKYYLARKYSFDINMDLIAGLPEESFDDFKNSINAAIDLSPENLTVHTLSLKAGSRLKEMVDRLPEGQIDKMIDYSYDRLTESGYFPYYMYRQKYMAGNLENTGYTKAGKACVYNVDVMEEIADNLACGANAVSKKLFSGGERIERYGAPKDISTYISKIDKVIEEKNKLFSSK